MEAYGGLSTYRMYIYKIYKLIYIYSIYRSKIALGLILDL